MEPSLKLVPRRPPRHEVLQVGHALAPVHELEVWGRVSEKSVSFVLGTVWVEVPLVNELIQDLSRVRIDGWKEHSLNGVQCLGQKLWGHGASVMSRCQLGEDEPRRIKARRTLQDFP